MNLGRLYWLTDLWLTMRSRRMNPPSPSGFQLDHLRNGTLGGSHDPYRNQESEIRYATVTYLMGVIGDQARTILMSLRTPKGHTIECLDKQLPECSCGAITYRERKVMRGELMIVDRYGDQPIQETRFGETYQRPVRNQDGEIDETLVWVRGPRPTLPTFDDVAKEAGITLYALRKRLKDADAKLEEHVEKTNAVMDWAA